MAKFLLFLLLILSLRSDYVLAQACYCTTTWSYNATFGQSCTANADCWACAPGAYSTSWQQAFCSGYQAPAPVVTCTTSFTEKTESCQVNYSGIKRYKQETRTCSDGQITNYGWQLYSDSCVQNPPTCQISTQTQTLSCQTGYVGSITQTQTSTCPNPYGQPVWSGSWVTSSNTCVKSLSNPTNVTSPVSPVSPTNPTFSTSVTTTQSAPVTAPTSVPTPTTATVGNDVPSQTNSAPSSPAPTSAKGTEPKTSPMAKMISPVNIVITNELIIKPNIQQYNAFPVENISQELPSHVKIHDSILMELLGLQLPNQDGQFKGMKSNTLEIEQ